MNQELNLWREKTKGLFNITEYKRFWNYISNLEQDNTMYAQLKDEYEEEIKNLQKRNSRQRLANQKQQELILKLQQEKDKFYLDNTMLKMEKDIYKQGYEDFKNLFNIFQNGGN